jgi:hypothetical protein
MASKGVAGSAVLLGTAGLYLAYAGVKDVPLIDGLRDIVRGKAPQGKPKLPYVPRIAEALANLPGGGSADTLGSATTGYGLVGNAARGYNAIKHLFPPGQVLHGRGDRPNNPNSDHPKGLALDVMTRDNAFAQRVISAFKRTQGAHYWIWNGRLGDADRAWISYAYTKFGGHYDHVHLSWR